MDFQEPLTPKNKESKKLIQNVQHELKFNNNVYLLTIELYSNEKINFNIRQINNISFYTYNKEYEYENLINILLLHKKYYNNISKVYNFLCTALSKNKIDLVKENNKMQIQLKKTQEFDEINCVIYLDKEKKTNEEMFNILSNEIKELKSNNNNNNDIINNLIRKNNNLENNLNLIIEQNNKDKQDLLNQISLLKNQYQNIMFKNQQLETNINFLTQEKNQMKFNLNQCNNYIEQINKQFKEEIQMMQIQINNLNCLNNNNNNFMQTMNSNNNFNNNYLNNNKDINPKLIPWKNKNLSIDDYTYLNASQKINIKLDASSGLKVELTVPKEMSIKDFFRLYCRKIGVPENLLGRDLIFLYNAEVLDINSEIIVSKIFRNGCYITVIDKDNNLGRFYL